MRSFVWCYSLFYWFCRFRVIHSLNNFPLLVRVCVSILLLPTERYKSKDVSIMTRAIKKWTTSHKSSRQARFHNINIFFLEVFCLQKSKGTWMVSTTVNLNSTGRTNDRQKATRTTGQTDRQTDRQTDGHISSTRPHWGPSVPSLGDKLLIFNG